MEDNQSSMVNLAQSPFLNGDSSIYLEQLYNDYLNNPASIPADWRSYFQTLSAASVDKPAQRVFIMSSESQTKVHALIAAYRLLGHLQADIDPLHRREKAWVPELMLSYYHLTDRDLPTSFDAGTIPGMNPRPFERLISDLNRLYCGTIASEFMHIPDSPERLWVQTQIENAVDQRAISLEMQKHLLARLTAAEGLERYLGAKYPGAKRFSLEGSDSLLVALDTLVQQGGASGAKEIMICMAHRGRLNVLVNLLGKTPGQLFDEFEGKHRDYPLELGGC